MHCPRHTCPVPRAHLIRFDAIEAELTETADRPALLRNRRFRRQVFAALDDMLGAADGAPAY
jgi:hypothetical protein